MRQSKITVVDSAIVYGARKEYVGVAPYPGTPIKGDTWEEFDGLNNFIESWVFNGTYWLSKDEDKWFFDIIASNANAATNHPVDLSTNIFITRFQASIFSTVASSGTNFVTWTLSRIANPNIATGLSSFNNSSPVQAINTWKSYINPVNLHVDLTATATTAMRLALTRSGAPGNVSADLCFYYKKARI